MSQPASVPAPAAAPVPVPEATPTAPPLAPPGTPQLTLRALITGAILGGFLSLSNLYVALRSGWSIGVTITAAILAFAIYFVFVKLRIVRRAFGLYENNAAKSVASAAGYMTGGGTVAAIPAVMMLTGEVMPWWQMLPWVAIIALLGVVTAIPMKRQMINVEQLRFPTGVACAETLKSLYASAGEGLDKAKALGHAGAIGALVAWFRDVKAAWMPWNLPGHLALPFSLGGNPALAYTFAFENSVIMLGAGALMGMRVAWSLLLGAVINFGILAPWMYDLGAIEALGYKNIVTWSVWFGSALLLTSGLTSFAFSWRTVGRAFASMGQAMKGGKGDPNEAHEVPMSWFVIGVPLLGVVAVFLAWFFFGISPFLGILAVLMSFFIAVVACRATGETDTTPTGALGKVTQLTFGALDPGNITTNLMTANVTAGIGLHSADLLTDLKTGYLVGASPRQQFWAQFFGVLAGSLFVVPAFLIMIPDASLLGSDKYPAPGAQTWAAVAKLLSQGFSTLHPSARWSLLIGGGLGILLPFLERWFPKARKYIPSSMGLGLAFTMPAWNAISMFLGATMAWMLGKAKPAMAERYVVPVSSGSRATAAGEVEGGADGGQHLVDLEGLLQVALRLDLRGPLPGVLGGGADHDRAEGAVAAPELPDELPAVHHRHPHVEQDHRRQLPVEALQRLAAVRGGDHPVAFLLEDQLEGAPEVEVVVDHQHRAAITPHRDPPRRAASRRRRWNPGSPPSRTTSARRDGPPSRGRGAGRSPGRWSRDRCRRGPGRSARRSGAGRRWECRRRGRGPRPPPPRASPPRRSPPARRRARTSPRCRRG